MDPSQMDSLRIQPRASGQAHAVPVVVFLALLASCRALLPVTPELCVHVGWGGWVWAPGEASMWEGCPVGFPVLEESQTLVSVSLPPKSVKAKPVSFALFSNSPSR